MNVHLALYGELTRRSVEDAIERLISLLDAIDDDPDLEPNGDYEPEETDLNGDEGDFDGGESDAPGFIWGGIGL